MNLFYKNYLNKLITNLLLAKNTLIVAKIIVKSSKAIT